MCGVQYDEQYDEQCVPQVRYNEEREKNQLLSSSGNHDLAQAPIHRPWLRPWLRPAYWPGHSHHQCAPAWPMLAFPVIALSVSPVPVQCGIYAPGLHIRPRAGLRPATPRAGLRLATPRAGPAAFPLQARNTMSMARRLRTQENEIITLQKVFVSAVASLCMCSSAVVPPTYSRRFAMCRMQFIHYTSAPFPRSAVPMTGCPRARLNESSSSIRALR